MSAYPARALPLALVIFLHTPVILRAETITRGQFLEYAQRTHPALTLARARSKTTELSRNDAGRWMNPMLELELAPRSLSTEPGYMARIRQPLTYGPGARTARQSRRTAATSALVQLRSETQMLDLKLNLLWVDALRTHEKEKLARQYLTLLQKLIRSTTGALATARVRPDALYMAQLLEVQAQQRWQESTALRDIALYEIAAAMGRSDTEGLVLADNKPTEPTLIYTSLDAFISATLRRAPELEDLRAKVMNATAKAQSENYSGVPPMALMAGYDSMQPMPDHRWQMGLELELPLANAERRTRAAMATADLAMLEGELRTREFEMRSEAVRLWSEFHTAQSALRSLQKLQLPLIEQQVQSMFAMVSTGDINLAAMASALQEKLQLEIELTDMLAQIRTMSYTMQTIAGLPEGE